MPRRSPQIDEYDNAKRDARIVELRRQRVPYRVIAEELGISGPRVYQIWKGILESIPAQPLELYRQEGRELADEAINDLLQVARKPTVSDATRVRAWEVASKWHDQIAKLNGEYAPVRRELEIHDTTNWEHQLRASIEEDARADRAAKALTVDYTVEHGDGD